jgi:hypothetical protein
MKTLIKTIIFSIIAFSGLLISCRTNFYQEPTLNSGTPSGGIANLGKYVAIGASIDAGFMDGALYTEGQNAAYPNLIANSIKAALPSSVFNQPTINSANGYNSYVSGQPVGRYVFLQITTCPSENLQRQQLASDNVIPSYVGNKSTLNNLAIPYLTSAQLNVPIGAIIASTVAGTNPAWYYDRIAPIPGTSYVSSIARQAKPTFFTVWIGYSEVLDYVQNGGVPSKALPTSAQFQQNLTILLDSLLANGATGVIANIPDLTLLPIVTNNNRRLIKTSDPICNSPISTSSTSGSVGAYKFTKNDSINFNSHFTTPIFKSGTNNGFVYFSSGTGKSTFIGSTTATSGVVDQLNLPPSTDLLISNTANADLVVSKTQYLDSLSLGPINYNCAIGNRGHWGITTPIPNNQVLDHHEIANIRAVIAGYNQVISSLVTSFNQNGTKLAFVDLYSFYNELTLNGVTTTNTTSVLPVFATGIVYASQPQLGPDFGGFYSLDRIHPTPKGQALIANEFLKVINKTYNANLPLIDVNQYRGNVVP